MVNGNLGTGPKAIEEGQRDDCRTVWQRPELRRLAANNAENSNSPCNDGSGGGCGPTLNHS